MGTRKGGTTSFHTYLTKHPDIYPFKIHGQPQDGEINNFQPGTEAYNDLFADVPQQTIVGESSVSRMQNDAAIIARKCDGIRLFGLLRDPVRRCHSQMLMRVRLHTQKISNISAELLRHLEAFQSFTRANPGWFNNPSPPLPPAYPFADKSDSHYFRSHGNCLYEGAYVVHLRRLLAAGVPTSSVRLYWAEDFFDKTVEVVKDALGFLGANPDDWNEAWASHTYNNAPDEDLGPNRRLEPETERLMRKAIHPWNVALHKFLGASSPWNV